MAKRTTKKKLIISGSVLLILVVLLLVTLGSCQISYLTQAMAGHLRIMHARQPIEKVLKKDNLDFKTKEKLKMVLDVRKFAVRELGLPDNKSYTLYSDIKSDYLGWNVYCTPEYSVEPKTWCYPVAGCVVYHGYFKKDKALAFAAKMKQDGLDICVSPFSAYSTLGWYNDPILSTNLDDDSIDLAGLIIHELAHQKFYKKDDSRFSEGFAMTVERAGVLRWLQSLGRSDQEKQAVREWDDYDLKVERMLRARHDLDSVYRSGRDTSFMRKQKDSILNGLEKDLNIKNRKLNNAYLVPVSTYHSLISWFQGKLDSCGGDFRMFYEEISGKKKPAPPVAAGTRPRIFLEGEWTVKLDSTIIKPVDYTVKLPGTLDENKTGIRNIEQLSSQLTRPYIYIGKAVYTRQVTIPAGWAGKQIALRMERSKKTTVMVDGQQIGSQNSLSTPHVYDLTAYLKPGLHTLSIEVDNDPATYKGLVGNSHALSEDTQTNWNGIIGEFCLEAMERISLERFQVYPDIGRKEVRVVCKVSNRTGSPRQIVLTVTAATRNTSRQPDLKPVMKTVLLTGDSVVAVVYPVGADAPLWDEFNPALYQLSVTLGIDGKEADRLATGFGLRTFSHEGNKFTINGRKTFLRGKHDGCVFPLTGHPPMNADEWLRLFTIAKSYGINHYRFHSWCPPEAAFEAADIAGMYLSPELPNWADFNVKNQAHTDFQVKEGLAILENYGSHPSFVMMTLGNEGGGDTDLMKQVVNGFRQADSRHLYAQGSNNYFWDPVQQPGDDFWVTMRTGKEKENYSTDTRGAFSFADSKGGGYINDRAASTDMTYSAALKNSSVPVVGHEVGQFQSYPDLNEQLKYTGVLEARNFRIFSDRLRKAGMADQAKDFAKASGALSVICYREEIEAALRTPEFGGFQLLDLQDYPGQGSALIGILDAFMDSKGFISPENWCRFCSEVVPLAVFPKYTWRNTEPFIATVKVANYGPAGLNGKTITYKLTGPEQAVIGSGTLHPADMQQGGLINAGTVEINLKNIRVPQRLDFEISVSGTNYKNSYPVWVYPEIDVPKAGSGILIADEYNDQVRQYLAEGKKVLLMPGSGHVPLNSVGGLFISDFWNYPMFKSIAERMKKEISPGTLGLLTNPGHPLFAGFPTEYHSNWQWWSITKNSHPIILDATDPGYRPIVQVIDNIDRNHKLGLVFEFKKGNGKLLVCSADLFKTMENLEVRHFYKSLMEYMNSDKFVPAAELSDKMAEILFRIRQ